MGTAEPEVNENTGKASLESIAGKLETIRKEDYENTRGVDQELAAIRLLQTSPWLNTPEIRGEFAKLDASIFDQTVIDLIEPASRAVLYLWGQFKIANQASTDPKLPESLAVQATELRSRMFKLVDYHFEGHSELEPIIAIIRSGGGYRDTAQDLIQLAKICEENRDEISSDRRNYRPEDVNEAYKISAQIHERLDLHSDERLQQIRDQLNRAWTLLVNSWDETRFAGQFLFRHDSEKQNRFVSVYSLGRRMNSGSTNEQ